MECQILDIQRLLDGIGRHHGGPLLLAREVFTALEDRGLRAFLSNISLEKLGVSEYTRAINEALDSAGVLVVVATSVANLNSEWVRYEWEGFFRDTLSGIKQGQLFAYIEGVELKALPRMLRQSQLFQHGRDSLERLSGFVANALGRSVPTIDLTAAYSMLSQRTEVEQREIFAIYKSGAAGFEHNVYRFGDTDKLSIDPVHIDVTSDKAARFGALRSEVIKIVVAPLLEHEFNGCPVK